MSLLDIPPSSFLPDAVQKLDYQMFSKLNGQWYNSFFDATLPFIREPFFWMPLYFFLILFVVLNFRMQGALWVLFILLTAMLSDYISSNILKDHFWRLRPCRDPLLADKVRFLVSYCPKSSSFTSSHAANHFALSMFIFTTLKKQLGNKWAFIFLWGAAICYAQVYVGVHFPIDVMAGAIIGLIIGYLTASLFNKKIGLVSN